MGLCGVLLHQIVELVALFTPSQIVAQSYQFLQSFLVGVSEEIVLNWHFEEGRNVVPILPYGLLGHGMVNLPKFLYFVGEYVKLLIVYVLLNGGLALQAIDDKPETDLRVLHADSHIGLKELRIPFSPQLFPFLVKFFNILVYFLGTEINEIPIGRIKEPILCLLFGFECNETHPVVGDCQHKVDHQWSFPFVVNEVVYVLVQLPLLLLGQHEVLVLELPGEGKQFKVRLVPEYLELLEVLKAEFVVSSLEVPIEDIFVPPRPFILQLIVPLDLEEEVLHLAFETPKGGAAEDVVVRVLSPEEVEEAEGVVGGVVAAEVASVLLVALGQVQVVVGTVLVLDELAEWQFGDLGGCLADIGEGVLEYLIPKLPDFLGDNGNSDLGHVQTIILINSYQAGKYGPHPQKSSYHMCPKMVNSSKSCPHCSSSFSLSTVLRSSWSLLRFYSYRRSCWTGSQKKAPMLYQQSFMIPSTLALSSQWPSIFKANTQNC